MENYTIEQFYTDYSSSSLEEFCKKLTEFQFRSFANERIELEDIKNVKTIPELADATMANLVPIYHDTMNRKTRVRNLKQRVREETDIWQKMGYLVDSFYEREKDRLSTDETIKKLSSADLRLAEVKKRLDGLNVLKTRMKLILTYDVKSIEEDIRDVSTLLQEHREDLSRIQSAVVTALDTGEISRSFWKTEN